MMSHYFQLGAQLALVCLLASGMFIAARVNYLLKIGLATVVVGLLVYSWTIAVDVLGYPVAGYPKDNTVLIDVNVDRNANAIYYWVKEKDGPRAYVVPYHEDQSNTASEAKAKAKQTQGQMVFHSKPKETGEERHGDHAQGSGNGGGGAGNGVGRGGGAPSQKAGLGGGQSQMSYGAAAGFGGEEPVEINIDVVPSLPAKN
jgi:hypothetical protein